MSAWDSLVGPASLAWLLATARLFAILRVQPAWRLAIGPWWTAVALGLAAMLAVAAVPVSSALPEVPGLLDAAVLVVLELGVGALLGLFASLPAYALLGAGAGSAVVLRAAPQPLIALTVSIVLATALALGLHQPVLAAATDTLVWLPLGDPWSLGLSPSGLATAAHTMLVLALALVTPVLLAGVTVEIAARLVGRGPGSAAGATSVAPWLRLAAALVALGASWSAYAPAWTRALMPPV